MTSQFLHALVDQKSWPKLKCFATYRQTDRHIHTCQSERTKLLIDSPEFLFRGHKNTLIVYIKSCIRFCIINTRDINDTSHRESKYYSSNTVVRRYIIPPTSTPVLSHVPWTTGVRPFCLVYTTPTSTPVLMFLGPLEILRPWMDRFVWVRVHGHGPVVTWNQNIFCY